MGGVPKFSQVRSTKWRASSGRSSIPTPLTLDFVISHIDDDHPVLQSAKARLDYKGALHQKAISNSGINVDFHAEARYIEPSEIAFDQSNNDSSLGLYVYKDLYDFGRSSAEENAALAEVEGSEWLLKIAKGAHTINLMAAYFDVLLADFTYI